MGGIRIFSNAGFIGKRTEYKPFELLGKSWPFSLAIFFLASLLNLTSLQVNIKAVLFLILLHQLISQILIVVNKYTAFNSSFLITNILNTTFISLLVMYSGGFASPLIVLYIAWIGYLAISHKVKDILYAGVFSITLYVFAGVFNTIIFGESYELSALGFTISVVSIFAFSFMASAYSELLHKTDNTFTDLKKDLERKLFELASIEKSLKCISEAANFKEFLKSLSAQMQTLFSAATVLVFVKEKNESNYKCLYSRGRSGARFKNLDIKASQELAFSELEGDAESKIIMPEELKVFFPTIGKKIKLKNALLASLKGEGSVRVVLCCFNKRELFDENDLRISYIICQQSNVMLTNILFLKHINLKEEELDSFNKWLKKSRSAFVNILEDVNKANEKMERALDQTLTMYKIAVELSKSLDESKLLESILKNSCKLIQAKSGSLILCRGSNMRQAMNHNYGGDLQVKSKKNPIRWIATSKQSLIINNFHNTSYRHYKLVSGVKNFLGVPLVQNDNTLGVLCLFNKEGDFSREDAQNLMTLAHQATVTILNARIYSREQKTIEKLTELDKMKADFVASVSHELRSPLTAIKGYLDLVLEEEAGPINKQQKEFLGYVDKSSQRLLNLIIDLLTVSKIESASLKMDKKVLSLNDVLKRVVKVMTPEVKEHDLEFKLDLKEKLPMSHADPNRLEEVVVNLISNAIKFSPKRSKIEVKSEVKDGVVVGSIKDYGIGISKSDRKQLFDKFFRSQDVVSKNIKGTGLGLAIVNGIIEKHQGKVWVESELGKGSTFYFTLPIKKKTAA